MKREKIEFIIQSILAHDGPDGHIDGNEIIYG